MAPLSSPWVFEVVIVATGPRIPQVSRARWDAEVMQQVSAGAQASFYLPSPPSVRSLFGCRLWTTSPPKLCVKDSLFSPGPLAGLSPGHFACQKEFRDSPLFSTPWVLLFKSYL